MRALMISFALLSLTGCVGTTGDQLFDFDASASGVDDAKGPFTVDGWTITLKEASLHVGGVYTNRAEPISGEQATSCVLPGIYVSEVTEGFDVNLLDASPQPFPIQGESTSDESVTGEVWLVHQDVNAETDTDPSTGVASIFTCDGHAKKGALDLHFTAQISIGGNRLPGTTDAAQPGLHPICKQRIVSPIPIDVTPKPGESLLLRIDAKQIFTNVDFSKLAPTGSDPSEVAFDDAPTNQPSINLYDNLHARYDLYSFLWR